LENRRSKNDEISGRMWEAVEAETRKIEVAKTKRRSEERERRKEARRERSEERRTKDDNNDKRKWNDKCKEGSGEMGNLG